MTVCLLWRNGRLDRIHEVDWRPLVIEHPFIDYDGSYYVDMFKMLRPHQGGELIDYHFTGRKST